VVKAFISLLQESEYTGVRNYSVSPVKSITLKDLADALFRMRDIRTELFLPDMGDQFIRALYSTYLSFLPENAFGYQLLKREDQRGSLAELIKSPHFGQFFISRTKPGFVRGNHYHNTKVEKFCVLDGNAIIRFRRISGSDILSYHVNGEEFRIVDIPPGYTHSIENVGKDDLVVLFWSSELFNQSLPDTYSLSVIEK
jgi:UDP-2-acetamido-2,6-beta-L-arabino-hexul-4-ose reductase